jgi:uncharacterized protein with PIN domain
VEVVRRFDLSRLVKPFSRCPVCNELLEPVAREEIYHDVPSRSRDYESGFARCPGCGKIYWHGSHARKLDSTVARILTRAAEQG